VEVKKAVEEELRRAREALKEAEEALQRGLYVLAVRASERAVEHCLKASSRMIGAPWASLGIAEHAKLIEDLIRRRRGEVEAKPNLTESEALAELKRAKELYASLEELLSEIEEA